MNKVSVLYVLVIFCFAFIIITTYRLQRRNGLVGKLKFVDEKQTPIVIVESSPYTDNQEKTNATAEQTVEEWTSTIILKSGDECPAVVKSESGIKKSRGCRIPELDPFHPSIMQYIRKTNSPSCSGTTYGTLWNGTLKFTDSNVVSATYRPIRRDGDFKYSLGPSVSVGTNKITDEMIEVDFKLTDGRVVKDFLLQVIPHKHLLEREATKKTGIPLNILTLGIDSLSYGNTRRKLPKLYEFLKNDLGAYFFNGHAIVGDGTTPQLTAMLTGLHVEEQYEARTGQPGAKPLDGWTWVFKELKERGYLTGLTEDGIWDGPFQYRLKGFTNPPTDFYPRPFFLDIAQRTKTFSDRCINNRNVPYIHLDYVRTVFDSFPNKLKFFVSFNAGYSHHEINDVQKNEPGVMTLLQHLKAKGYLNNTLLIVMGDHGLRFGPVRTKVQGKLEERLPLFAMAFPSWFAARYPKLTKVLETNTDRLTSWFDVHATYRHILSYPDLPMNEKRGISLFEEIPVSRTCANAGITDHWCPCLQWETVKVEHSHIQNAALAAVEYMNDLLKKDSVSASLCANLTLKVINFAQLERPNEAVVKRHLGKNAAFKQSQEYFCRYQLQFVTLPNEGVFEATVKFHKKRFIVNTSISRINKYGDQPKCVAAKMPHVRKYCLCKDYDGPL